MKYYFSWLHKIKIRVISKFFGLTEKMLSKRFANHDYSKVNHNKYGCMYQVSD